MASGKCPGPWRPSIAERAWAPPSSNWRSAVWRGSASSPKSRLPISPPDASQKSLASVCAGTEMECLFIGEDAQRHYPRSRTRPARSRAPDARWRLRSWIQTCRPWHRIRVSQFGEANRRVLSKSADPAPTRQAPCPCGGGNIPRYACRRSAIASSFDYRTGCIEGGWQPLDAPGHGEGGGSP